MRTHPDSDSDANAVRIELPVLVKLPDLDVGAGNSGADDSGTATCEQGDHSDEATERRNDQTRRHRKTDPKGSARRPTRITARVLQFKSHLLATIIVLTFVLLIGTLLFHKGSVEDEFAGPSWEVGDTSAPDKEQHSKTAETHLPDSAIPRVHQSLPRRLPSLDASDASDAVAETSLPQETATPRSSPILTYPNGNPSIGTAVYPQESPENRDPVRLSEENNDPTETVR